MNTTCPYCNYKATEHETLDKEKNPGDQDISFCINCGEVSTYENCKLIKINIESLNKPTRKEVNRIRVVWLRRRAMGKVKK